MSSNTLILPASDRPPVQHQASMLSGRSIAHTVCPAGIGYITQQTQSQVASLTPTK